ncbi:MAG TPA: DNA polymerase II [Spirochaetia bacterium]|nr:DNA polymerase II [Spirochaetia bacterium]
MDRGYIVHAREQTRAGRTAIHLFGRLEGGQTFAVVEKRLKPFFHVRTEDAERARAIADSERHDAAMLESRRRSMDGAGMTRIETASVGALQRFRDSLHRAGVRTYEADVKLSTQLLMDLGIHGTVSIDGPWREGRRVARVYEDPTLGSCAFEPALSTLSLDIETDPRAQTVYAVSLCREGSEVVLFNGAGGGNPHSEMVRRFPDEKQMLAELRRRIVELDPDVITGWNVVDFDLRVLTRRFAALGVPFDIGRSDEPASFLDRQDADGITRWKRSKAVVPGRQVLDALWLVRFAGMGLEDYRLETVAQNVLGRGKRIEEKPGESRTAAVQRLYREDPTNLCLYCLEDARLVLEILGREGLLELALQKTLLIGTSLEQTSMSVAAFEFLYTEHLHSRGIVAPTLGVDQDSLERVPGGGIITPRAGLYENVLAFDFKSLYPSIIRTFNIDPLSRVREAANTADAITAPNGAVFRREPGILPGILDRFFESRDAARKAGNARAVYSLKIVMNSFYGVLGTPGCRFAASPLAGAITSFGQHILYWARDQVVSKGYDVIYGDTDSLFVLIGGSPCGGLDQLAELGRELARDLNERLAQHVQATYRVASRLELEFEALYSRFFLPPMRTPAAQGNELPGDDEEGEGRGRAKGYAGLHRVFDGNGETTVIEVVGLEAVRHDWTPLAQELQRGLLEMVFHDAEPSSIKQHILGELHDLRAGKRDEKLVYRRSLRKRIDNYGKSAPPHVRAALLLPAEERSGLIRYIWTTDGPQPESRTTSPPDYEHYVQKQVRPIVESIAPFIGLSTEDLFLEGGQLGLF